MLDQSRHLGLELTFRPHSSIQIMVSLFLCGSFKRDFSHILVELGLTSSQVSD